MHLVIEVSDNGPGIPESLLLDNQSMLKRGNVNSTGLGIGMAMMREAAQKMNGAIVFENTRPRGMRARLMLLSRI
jgi:C4-dicarboxylate-specific signal transduction histidine kinase